MYGKNEGTSSTSQVSIIKDLCWHLCSGLPDAEIKKVFKSSILTYNSLDTTGCETWDDDEILLCRQIEKQLRSLNKSDVIPDFNLVHRRLRSNECRSLLPSARTLYCLLLKVSEGRSAKNLRPTDFPRGYLTKMHKPFKQISSDPEVVGRGDSSVGFKKEIHPFGNVISRKGAVFAALNGQDSQNHLLKLKHHSSKARPTDSLSLFSASPLNFRADKVYASEEAVISELIYTFQGVPGNIFKLDTHQGFVIDPMVKIRQFPIVIKLLEVGYLHNKVLSMCSKISKNGSVAHAVETVIKQMMSDYYGIVGELHAEINKMRDKWSDDTPLREDGPEPKVHMTFRGLLVWSTEPIHMLKILCDALHFASDCKGGAILSSLDRLRHHGDPRYQRTCRIILSIGGNPLMQMIKVWILNGELQDPHDEFFISVNDNCPDRDIWKDKFILRTTLIPNIMTEQQADMILRSGKAIKFLNVIGEQRVPIKGMRKKLESMEEIHLLDLSDPRSELSLLIIGIFKETSNLVLETLINKFKLFQHFQGLRRYILLGQGDFTNCFMELVEPEMRKPASSLHYHELMGLLASAVRCSSAAYEDPDIMRRVSVKLLVASGGDWGSEVFGLQYFMQETLDAAFGLSDGAYSHMFNFLWRTKRMEYILLSLRRERWETKNILNSIATQVPEVTSVLVLADRISQELVHFARQFHYYILFEVVECLWEKFSEALKKATSLDEVIQAHSIFIREIQAQTFQDEASRKFINELRLIWDLVYELESLERKFFSQVNLQAEYRETRERRLSSVGTNYEDEAEFEKNCKQFKAFLSSARAQYCIILRNYQNDLKKFLLELSNRKDHQLRMLGTRLDYNEYYNKSDARIIDSMKFSHYGDVFE